MRRLAVVKLKKKDEIQNNISIQYHTIIEPYDK